MTGDLDFEDLVKTYYAPLYRFALSLTRRENDACDLTQQTFLTWAAKGHQLREAGKVKTWLFTTLHREFLRQQRRQKRISHQPLEETAQELPAVEPAVANHADAVSAITMLHQLDEIFQAPLALYYLEDCSYNTIAEILDIPLGTVKSRISRGLALLQDWTRDGAPDQTASPGKEGRPS